MNLFLSLKFNSNNRYLIWTDNNNKIKEKFIWSPSYTTMMIRESKTESPLILFGYYFSDLEINLVRAKQVNILEA